MYSSCNGVVLTKRDVPLKFLALWGRRPGANDPTLRLPEEIVHQVQRLQYWLGEEKKSQEQTGTLFRRLRDDRQYQTVLMQQIERGDRTVEEEEAILRKRIPT